MWLLAWLVWTSALSGSGAQAPTACDGNWHSLETEASARGNCGPSFEDRCTCQRLCFEFRHAYVVNCTDSLFANASVLGLLPEETEVLIMRGNHFKSLPWNVFGEVDRLPHLTHIDLSNNAIEEIHGKAFHHVKSVKTLILDFNKLSVKEEKTHPRVFSNFESLEELHLSNAFEDVLEKELDEILYEIFDNSNLTKLGKIHLEQNKIMNFANRDDVFCKLPNLYDIYLGDNLLQSVDFQLTCLKNFRFLDLRRNRFKSVRREDMRYLDEVIKKRADKSVQFDFTENPFECSCELNPFVRWARKVQPFLRSHQMLMCKVPSHKNPVSFYESKSCGLKLKSSSWTARSGATVLLCLLSLILISLIFALFYVERVQLKRKLEPVIESVHKRVRYTSIATSADAQEINV